MKLQLTIDIFSGRPNPTLIVSDNEAKKIFDAIRPETEFAALPEKAIAEPFNLGYRGIIVEQIGEVSEKLPRRMRITPHAIYAGRLMALSKSDEFEKLIFARLKEFKGIPDNERFEKMLRTEAERFAVEYEGFAKQAYNPNVGVVTTCVCAPPHEIVWWNDGGTIQNNNNCYNYSTNYRTDTFAQPGYAAGTIYTDLSACSVPPMISAKDGAVADCLIDTPNANNNCPNNGHLVALVIFPYWDYHFYRKGAGGNWSHKPGITVATLVDNSANPITDPRTADRGPYTLFCTFMQVIHGHIKLN